MRLCLWRESPRPRARERENVLNAAPYERNEERAGYANGFKPKRYLMGNGVLNLKIAETRGVSFYPQCLEKGLRSERALKVALAESYLLGVSTYRTFRVGFTTPKAGQTTWDWTINLCFPLKLNR
jgi:hypothetical protein